MSEPGQVWSIAARALALGAVIAGALALAGPARACTPVEPQVVLCTEGTAWAAIKPRLADSSVVWKGTDFWLVFDPAITEALTAMGGGPAALDALIAPFLVGTGEGGPHLVLRDRFTTESTMAEWAVVQLGRPGETYFSAVLLSAFTGGGPSIGWTAGSVKEVPLDDLLGMIAAAAAGLRLGTGN